MTLTTPATAPGPYSAEPPPLMISIRSIRRVGDLLEAVDHRQAREERLAVEEHLRVLALQAEHAQLGEVAVLAAVEHPQAGRELDRLGQRAGADRGHVPRG
jgi:hypothetical protein